MLIVQPSLAKYRAPVFRELAARPGIELTLWFGDEVAIKNVEPDGFVAEEKHITIRRFLGQEFRWHTAQLEAVASNDYDVVVLSWSPRYLSLLPALRRAKHRGLPVVLWGHGYSKNDSPLRTRLRNALAWQAPVLLLYDSETAARLVGCGFAPDRVYTAPNAIDQIPIQHAAAPYRSRPELLADFRREQAIEKKRCVIFVSRLYAENRVDLLIDAVENLREEQPDLCAVIVGDGPDRARLEERAAGMGDRVRFLGAIFDEQTLAPWMLASDALVYPANIGLSLLHAFGYGLPVVTGDNIAAQNPEIVALQHEHNGLLFRDGDAVALAVALGRLLSDDAFRRRLGAAAQQAVDERFNIPMMVDGMEAAVRAAVQAGKGDP